VSSKVMSLTTAVEMIEDGSSLAAGGVLLVNKPLRFLDAVGRHGRRGLRYHTFLGSLDVEVLIAHNAVAELHTGYVGFEELGFAPRYQAAVRDESVRVVEYTEYLFMTGIRAAAAGLPFMPTKGGMGSDLGAELGFVEIEDPYSDCRVMAVPALHPDVAVVHTRLADPLGNVAAPRGRTFLWDYDANVSRAAGRVIATAEEVVDPEDFRARADGVLLYAHEVDAVVHLPGGAFPSGIGGHSTIDVDAVRRYLAHAEADTETALAELFT
jgi:glutaconate CoA-transferase subunit A